MAWSTYMAGIRAQIGESLLLTPAAGVAVFDQEGCLLLLRHVHDGKWGTPGGGMEPGESPEEGARREVVEETGLQLPDLELVGAFGGPDFEVTYGGDSVTAYVVILYGAVVDRSRIQLQLDEVNECGWSASEELIDLDLPPDMKVMLPTAFQWNRSRR